MFFPLSTGFNHMHVTSTLGRLERFGFIMVFSLHSGIIYRISPLFSVLWFYFWYVVFFLPQWHFCLLQRLLSPTTLFSNDVTYHLPTDRILLYTEFREFYIFAHVLTFINILNSAQTKISQEEPPNIKNRYREKEEN